MITHCVYFTLNDKSSETLSAFLEDSRMFGKNISEIQWIHVGTPMPGANRPIHDKDFDVAIVSAFASAQTLQAYLDHPDHVDYCERNKAIWKQLRVFDAEC